MENDKTIQLEKRIKELENVLKKHTHLGYDKSSKLRGEISLDGKSQFSIGNSSNAYFVSGSETENENMRAISLIGNSPGYGTSNRTMNSQLIMENQTEPYNIYRGNWATATAYDKLNAVRAYGYSFICKAKHTSGASTEPGVGADWADYWQVMNYWSFYYAYRQPLVSNSVEVSVTSGASTLQDTTMTFGVNELADAYIRLTGDTTGLEVYKIASNTIDTITIDGTWTTTATDANYVISRPVYLGSAGFPWKRLYLTDDIRFGTGASGGSDVIFIKYGADTPEASVTANIGSLYLRTNGSTGTTLYIKESGTGNTGWVAQSAGGGEYAVGDGSRGSTTGDQAITGVGFKPKLVVIKATYEATPGGWSIGRATGTSDEYCNYQNVDTEVGHSSAHVINITATGDNEAIMKSIDDDGFTLTWSTSNDTIYFSYECFG